MLHNLLAPPVKLNSLHKARNFNKKKRVSKACYPCRIKKTKCDGIQPCSKCTQENRICTYSENIKQKVKTVPNGYVELLETRMDLLTKGIEKIILMARPHLQFLERIIGDKQCVPINDVITYLLNEEGLVKNMPIEWEDGTIIAANVVTDDNNSVNIASKYFEEYNEKRRQCIREKELEEKERIKKEKDVIELGENKLALNDSKICNNFSSNICNEDENDIKEEIIQLPMPHSEMINSNKFMPVLDGTLRAPVIANEQQIQSEKAEKISNEIGISLTDISDEEFIKLNMFEDRPCDIPVPFANIEYPLKTNSEILETLQGHEIILQSGSPFPNCQANVKSGWELNSTTNEQDGEPTNVSPSILQLNNNYI